MLLVIVSPAKVPFVQGALAELRQYAKDLHAAEGMRGAPAGEDSSARGRMDSDDLPAAEAEAPDVVADSAGRQTKTKELLEELAKYEENILNDDGSSQSAAGEGDQPSEPPTAAQTSGDEVPPVPQAADSQASEAPVQEIRKDFYVASSDGKGSARLAEVLKQNETLTAQTEELAREVGKLRTILNKARQVQELYVAERTRSKELETSLATCTAGGEGSASVSMLNTKNQELERQLEARGGELKTCQAQLQTTSALADSAIPMRQELAQATTDLELLREENQILLKGGSSKAVQTARAAKTRPARGAAAATPATGAAAPVQPPLVANTAQTAVQAAPVPASDVPLIEVIADRASIRSGPGTENSSMMDVAKGSRLTVESQEGEWFHVVTPTGGRGYIHAGVVRRLGNQAAPARRADASPPVTTVPSPLSQTSVAPSASGPAKPAARTAQAGQDEALEPFGAVNLAGKPATDPESRARALMNTIRARQAASGQVAPEKFEAEAGE